MKIAIQAADLDSLRIDGTRVYILNLLKYFGQLDQESQFLIYHKKDFNPELCPPDFPNYKIIRKNWPIFWTQMRLACSLWREKPDVLWMPMHNIPLFRPKKIKTVVTIHDLAFRYYPETFTRINLFKINFLTKMAVKYSDKIIAVSESTKKDILKFYPWISQNKIRVIYHGFNSKIFQNNKAIEEKERIYTKYKIPDTGYILYIGAIQPRKNLEVLVKAFEKLKKDNKFTNLKLVLAGERAWLWEDVFRKINVSEYKTDIIALGKVKFSDLGCLMRGAEVFCFPSLYEGFGLPILEAFASEVPVVCSRNSSLPEVAGDAALYFDGKNPGDLAEKIQRVLASEELKKDLIAKGLEQIKKFSWEKCARETLEYLKS
jgi:glycosyltransferase involved in cell wall biosynthesis